MSTPRSLARPILAALGGVAGGLLALVPVLPPVQAQSAVMGGARAIPYPEAVQVARKAAQAVLARGGKESCLRGKLTNALLGLSASCDRAGQRNALCDLADKAVVQLHWPLAFMDETSQELLDLIAAGSGDGTPSAAVPALRTPDPASPAP